MLPKIIVSILSLRIVIDLLYPGPKPGIIVAVYALTMIATSIFLLLKSQERKGHKTTVLIIFVAVSLAISTLYSSVEITSHLNFVIQTFVPILFLLSCTNNKETLRQSGVLFKKLIAAPALILVIAAAYYDYKTNNALGLGLFDYYANNPNHVTAQTTLKISLIFLLDSIALTAFSFTILLLLNVRSAIISYFLAVAFYFKNQLTKKSIIKKTILVLVPIIVAGLLFADPSSMLDRFIFKGRSLSSGNVFSEASSGRVEIYHYYIDHLINRFTLFDWMFGKGPVWLNSIEQNLSAHNDVLNIIISFGLLGLISISVAYYIFFSSLPERIRTPATIAFVTLFLTNGVVFHQSSVLFSILYLYSVRIKYNHHERQAQTGPTIPRPR